MPERVNKNLALYVPRFNSDGPRKSGEFHFQIAKFFWPQFFYGANIFKQHAASIYGFVRMFVSFVSFVKKNSCLNDQAYNCLIHFYSRLT